MTPAVVRLDSLGLVHRVLEYHHDAKIDAPSGTAMLTVERMGEKTIANLRDAVAAHDAAGAGHGVLGRARTGGERGLGGGGRATPTSWYELSHHVRRARRG